MSKKTICEHAFDHEPGTTCEHCKLLVDAYGNTEEDFLHCSFPDCGCDGARLCMAGKASDDAILGNVEGMYERNDLPAMIGKGQLLRICIERNKKEMPPPDECSICRRRHGNEIQHPCE